MVSSKKTYISANFTFGDIPLQASKGMNYLGFVISYNGKYRSITHDRIIDATRMFNMDLQAIRTNRNVSVRRALSYFDSQITFFFMDAWYGRYPPPKILFTCLIVTTGRLVWPSRRLSYFGVCMRCECVAKLYFVYRPVLQPYCGPCILRSMAR